MEEKINKINKQFNVNGNEKDNNVIISTPTNELLADLYVWNVPYEIPSEDDCTIIISNEDFKRYCADKEEYNGFPYEKFISHEDMPMILTITTIKNGKAIKTHEIREKKYLGCGPYGYNEKIVIPRNLWEDEFCDEHPITSRTKLQDLMAKYSGCVEAQLYSADNNYTNHNEVEILFHAGHCENCILSQDEKESAMNKEIGAFP